MIEFQIWTRAATPLDTYAARPSLTLTFTSRESQFALTASPVPTWMPRYLGVLPWLSTWRLLYDF